MPVPREIRAARAAATTFFVAMGLTAGVWVSRIPAVKQQTGLNDARLGLALLAVPVGLVLGTALAGRFMDRAGSGRMTWAAGVALCLVTIGPGLPRTFWGLAAALFAVGLSAGMQDVGQNAQGVRVETEYGRPIVTSMHAGYSLGAIVGALVGGGFAWAGIGPAQTLAAIGVPGAVASCIAGRWLLHSNPPPAPAPSPSEPAGRAGRVRTVVIVLGLLAISGMVGEGAAGDWSAVYLHDNLGTSAGFAALAYAAFSVTMTAGRFGGDRLVARFGVVRVIRACGLVAGGGLIAGLLAARAAGGSGAPAAVLAIAGFALLGAGLSVTVPQVFAAGGRADPARPARGLATVVGMGYAGMTGGPPVIGFVAGWAGLPVALGIPAVLALGLAFGAGTLGRPGLTVGTAGYVRTVGQKTADHAIPGELPLP